MSFGEYVLTLRKAIDGFYILADKLEIPRQEAKVILDEEFEKIKSRPDLRSADAIRAAKNRLVR